MTFPRLICGEGKARHPNSCSSISNPQLLLLFYLYSSPSFLRVLHFRSTRSCARSLTREGGGTTWGARTRAVISSKPCPSGGHPRPAAQGHRPRPVRFLHSWPGLLPGSLQAERARGREHSPLGDPGQTEEAGGEKRKWGGHREPGWGCHRAGPSSPLSPRGQEPRAKSPRKGSGGPARPSTWHQCSGRAWASPPLGLSCPTCQMGCSPFAPQPSRAATTGVRGTLEASSSSPHPGTSHRLPVAFRGAHREQNCLKSDGAGGMAAAESQKSCAPPLAALLFAV